MVSNQQTVKGDRNADRVYEVNPLFGRKIQVGDVVTEHYSKRKITVSRVDRFGFVWELIETDHPAYRLGGERYIGLHYDEFEPMLKLTEGRHS